MITNTCFIITTLSSSGKEVEGIECSERAILPKKSFRDKLETLIDSDFSKQALLSTIKVLNGETKNTCCKAVSGVLEYLLTLSEVPQPYKHLLQEIRKDSPISSWLVSYSQSDSSLFISFLAKKKQIFNNLEDTTKFTHAFPYLARKLQQFLKLHSSKFLPKHLSDLMYSFLSLRENFDIKAEERAVKRTRQGKNHKSAPVDCYPNNPEHTVENFYKADLKTDKTEDKSCSKIYNSKSAITGGITHISCEHGVVKGFTALHRGESPLQVLFS